MVFTPKEIVDVFFKTDFWIAGHTTIIKKELVINYGGLNEDLGPFCDWFLFHSIALNFGVAYIPEDLSVWRINKKSYSVSGEKKMIDQLEVNLFKAMGSNRKKFKSSGLMKVYVYKRFLRFCFFPKYWDFMAHTLYRSAYIKFRRIFHFFVPKKSFMV